MISETPEDKIRGFFFLLKISRLDLFLERFNFLELTK